VFMKIEEPEHPLIFQTAAAAMVQPPRTIGEFYSRIKQQIQTLEAEAQQKQTTIFTGDPARQATSGNLGVPSADQKINSAASAAKAINFIVEQGEGTTTSPKFGDDDGFAHYYRFAELAGGKKLVPNPVSQPTDPPDKQYLYGPDPIPFDPTRVLPLVENPRSAQYPPDVRAASDQSNRLYTNILKALHDAFNGSPSRISEARDLMGDLSGAVAALTAMTVNGTQRAGPTFEFMP
jgi:hypothetical protein